MNITFTKIDPDAYLATDGINTVEVMRGWARSAGGDCWAVSFPGQMIYRKTRKQAAEVALARVAAGR